MNLFIALAIISIACIVLSAIVNRQLIGVKLAPLLVVNTAAWYINYLIWYELVGLREGYLVLMMITFIGLVGMYMDNSGAADDHL